MSVVRIEEGVVEVISSHGNNHLGGDDFDHKIVEHVLEHPEDQGMASTLPTAHQAMARILRSAEAAKHLSDHPYARMAEEYLTDKDGVPVNFELSRDVPADDHAVHRGSAPGPPSPLNRPA